MLRSIVGVIVAVAFGAVGWLLPQWLGDRDKVTVHDVEIATLKDDNHALRDALAEGMRQGAERDKAIVQLAESVKAVVGDVDDLKRDVRQVRREGR